jgi:carbon storage regulator
MRIISFGLRSGRKTILKLSRSEIIVGNGAIFFSRSLLMLILTRRVGESVLIGDEIEIVVTAIGGDQVRIGFDAPREVEIVRSELKEQRNRKFLFDDL